MKAVVEFKWHKSAKNYFLLDLLFHTLHSILFIIGISVRDNNTRKITMFCVLICGAFVLLMKVLKLIKTISYICTFRNYFEVIYTISSLVFYFISIILPMIVAVEVIFNKQLTSGLVGASMLLNYMRLVSNL